MKVLTRTVGMMLLVAVLFLLVETSGIIPLVDYRCYDLLTNIAQKPAARVSSSIVVVEIDEASLRVLGQWPWPRVVLARILEKILLQRPAAVGFDILFPEADRTSPVELKKFYRENLALEINIDSLPPELRDHDRIFARALAAGSAVLSLYLTGRDDPGNCDLDSCLELLQLPSGLDVPQARQVLCNYPVLQQAVRNSGFINAAPDSDGILRRNLLFVYYHDQGLPCLALAMLAQVDNGIKIARRESGWSPVGIDFAGRSVCANRRGEILNHLHTRSHFRTISAFQLLAGGVPAGLFSGKMVLVGATATGLFDQYATAGGETLPGVFSHASLLENLLAGRVAYQPVLSRSGALLLSFFFSVLLLNLVARRHYLLSWTIFGGASLAVITLAGIMLPRGVYLSPGYFLTPFFCLFFIVSLFFAILHYFERRRFLEELGEAHSAAIDSMTMVAESRDLETGAHIVRTKEYVVTLARTLRRLGHYREKLSPRTVELLYRAAPLHDIGKVGIPDAILCKPGKLTAEEYRVMQSHVEIGYSILKNAINSYSKTNEFLIMAANIAYCHHEKWDGSGYPRGIAGEEIPLEGRLMAVADVFDALVSARCYKGEFSFAEAERIIIAESGSHFDPLIVAAFKVCSGHMQKIALRNRSREGLSPGGVFRDADSEAVL
jgi:adenylate cyclase